MRALIPFASTLPRLPAPGTYLTPAEKARELVEWFARDDLSDPGARELLEPLNRIDGVCTVQSCIGHVKQTSTVKRYVESGHIEMRLDELATARFYEAMPILRAVPGCETVELHWRVASEQRATVWFAPGHMAAVAAALAQVLAPPIAETTEGATEESCS